MLVTEMSQQEDRLKIMGARIISPTVTSTTTQRDVSASRLVHSEKYSVRLETDTGAG